MTDREKLMKDIMHILVTKKLPEGSLYAAALSIEYAEQSKVLADFILEREAQNQPAKPGVSDTKNFRKLTNDYRPTLKHWATQLPEEEFDRILTEYGSKAFALGFRDVNKLIAEQKVKAQVEELSDMVTGFEKALSKVDVDTRYVFQPLIDVVNKRIAALTPKSTEPKPDPLQQLRKPNGPGFGGTEQKEDV